MTTANSKVTKSKVDKLEPGEIIWDSEIKGFGCRCQAQGKFYVLKYRVHGKRQRWYTIGQHGSPWTPEKARKEALKQKEYINRGGDPSKDKEKGRNEKSISELCDRFLKEHVRSHNKPSTIKAIERSIEKRIKPGLGKFTITSITRADIKRWHQSMSNAPFDANRNLAYFSKMMSLAATEWELRPDNPCKGIKRFPEKARERYFKDDELKRIGLALLEIEEEGLEPLGFVLLVRLLAVTGMRLGEALSLNWNDVDLKEKVIRLKDAKAGGRTVNLGASTIAQLSNYDSRDGYVITGRKPNEPLSENIAEKCWDRLRTRAKIIDGRLHDLRHTVGTLAALGGANAFVVRDILGHKTLAMTNRYVERAAELTKATIDTVSSRVDATMRGKNAEILEMPKRKA